MEDMYLWADGTMSDEPLHWKSDDYIIVNGDTTLEEIAACCGSDIMRDILEEHLQNISIRQAS